MDPQSIPPPSTKDPNDWREYMKKCQLLQAKIDGFTEVLATPLLEVFSVSIQSHLHDDGEPCQIYGTIQVKDVKGTSFELYNRELTEPETIYIGGALSLTGPQDRAIFPCGVLEMELHIMDKTRGIEVVDDVLLLNHNCREDYDEVITKYARGKHSSASVCYTTYQSAVAAVVEVRYVNEEDTQVYGSVRACCVNGDDYPFNDFEQEYSKKKKNSSSVLFERPSNQPVRVNTRTPLVLSRSIVAVPATSCLIVEVDLSSCDPRAKSVSGTLKFLATHYGLSTKDIMDQNGHDLVRMQVLWTHSHLQISDASSKHEEEGKNQQQRKKGKLIPWNQPPLECPLMEVFSISIGCNHNEVKSIYGTIEVKDEFGSYHIFNKARESLPENVYRYNKLACLGFNSFRGHKLNIDVDLTDAEGKTVSKGKVMWDEDNIKFPLPWYDTPLCSVIPGEQQNYARVHYTILSSGLQAKVSLHFSSDSSAKFPVSIHGSLVAQYSSYDYSTYYESEYYKSVLLEMNPENPLLLSSDSEIQLSKYIVSVPIDSVLIIEADLWAGMSGRMTDSWCKTVLVLTDKAGKFHEVLRGKHHQIDLRVETVGL